MEQSADFTQIIRAFRDQVSIKPWKKFSAPEDNGSPRETTNRFRKQGLESQNDKASRLKNPPQELKRPEECVETTHREQKLHDMIVENPVLLHTPELYAGGLYLDSILNKQDLGFFRKNDFGFITAQGYTIKITLVEIEQAAKRVFHNKLEDRTKFRSETKGAIAQVKQWQEKLRAPSRQKSFLANLKPLFDHYPLELFSEDEEPLPNVTIEFSYMLVVGNERPTYHQHQTLIDDLYINDNILFMTYPMMIEQVEKCPYPKNVLTIGALGVSLKTLHRPASLGHGLMPLSLPIEDPFGIKIAGLGHHLQQPSELAMAPGMLKKAFYRSGGFCEKPGCGHPLITDLGVQARLCPIYNAFDDDYLLVRTQYELNNVALTCPSHNPVEFNNGVRFAIGKEHPLNAAMKKRGPYRHELDVAANLFCESWIKGIPESVVAALEVDAVRDAALVEQIKVCALALRSLPRLSEAVLRNIVEVHYGAQYASKLNRSPELIDSNSAWRFLFKAGLIRINHKAKAGDEIEPTIFSRELIELIEKKFHKYSFFGFAYLCSASEKSLTRYMKRAKEEVVIQDFAYGKHLAPQFSPSHGRF